MDSVKRLTRTISSANVFQAIPVDSARLMRVKKTSVKTTRLVFRILLASLASVELAFTGQNANLTAVQLLLVFIKRNARRMVKISLATVRLDFLEIFAKKLLVKPSTSRVRTTRRAR